jgi:hypothetical protein
LLLERVNYTVIGNCAVKASIPLTFNIITCICLLNEILCCVLYHGLMIPIWKYSLKPGHVDRYKICLNIVYMLNKLKRIQNFSQKISREALGGDWIHLA